MGRTLNQTDRNAIPLDRPWLDDPQAAEGDRISLGGEPILRFGSVQCAFHVSSTTRLELI
jgi:hypothetical protein